MPQLPLWYETPTNKKEITKQRKRDARESKNVEDVLSKMRTLHEELNALLYVTTEKPAINSPADAAALIRYELESLDHEELIVMPLDRRNKVLQIIRLYKGSVNSSQVRIAEVFRDAIKLNASSLIVAHNHPSGDPTPSPDDVGLTRAIVQAGKLLDIDLLDHVVIGFQKWVSLKERGLGFN